MPLSRRTLIRTGAAATVVGVAAVAGLETGAIPVRARVHDVLGLTGPDGVGALLWVALNYFERRVRPGMRAVAVGAMSPALWREYGEVAAGAFDDAGDFERSQVFGRPNGFRDVAVRIDCGRDDPFADAARALRVELGAAGGEQAGAHTAGYWRRMLPDQLEFLGAKLAG